MPSPAEEAASQLRAIRALMENSTVYRAISAPAAGFAGLLSLGVCGWLWLVRDSGRAPSPEGFAAIWLGVLFLVSLVNAVLLRRSARARGEAFVSPGMKHALRALLPPLFAGFWLSVRHGGGEANMASLWILFYGLALLATGSFSPRSMRLLGVVFFGFGLLAASPELRGPEGRQDESGILLMALSFGLFHLIYAAAVILRSRRPSSGA